MSGALEDLLLAGMDSSCVAFDPFGNVSPHLGWTWSQRIALRGIMLVHIYSTPIEK
jgi:hypothetical protein